MGLGLAVVRGLLVRSNSRAAWFFFLCFAAVLFLQVRLLVSYSYEWRCCPRQTVFGCMHELEVVGLKHVAITPRHEAMMQRAWVFCTSNRIRCSLL